MALDRDDARLSASRHAARLFLERGVAGASGEAIAEAAGVSKRTLWRYFRSKESCVEPLFSNSALRFGAKLRRWPREASIESHLHDCFDPDKQTAEDLADEVLVARLVALMPDEPALRGAWLMSCQASEEDMTAVIADRLDRSPKDFDVRLCAATVTAAIRVVDEAISVAAIRRAQKYTLAEVIGEMARAIRAASVLPICDPIAPDVFGRKP